MSVPVRDRTESEFTIITKAESILVEAIRIVKAGKCISKRYNRLLADPFVDNARRLLYCVSAANDMNINDKAEFVLRGKFQVEAKVFISKIIVDIKTILGIMDCSMQHFSNLLKLVSEEKQLLARWIKSDVKRAKTVI